MEKPDTWTLNMTQMLAALSDALDYVEGELVGARLHHAKRISCLCAVLGEELGMSERERFDLVSCALLHDCALPEYIATEYDPDAKIDLGAHCVSGEANMKHLPVFGDVTNVLLYHHENADGSGPFSKRTDETPLYARLIHMTDVMDVTLDLSGGASKAEEVRALLKEQSGKMFDPGCVALLLERENLETLLAGIGEEHLSETMKSALPQISRPLTATEVEDFALLFAAIVDYKSSFTARHSQGVAEKALCMADYYGVRQPERMQLLLAGALHDIGKLLISNDILEKPGRLTSEEYLEIQNHAYATWQILLQIDGLEQVTCWAACHHEKLDGSGYPFGLTAKALDKNARLMACVDIYQAMTEPRPYKSGLPHSAAMQELKRLSEKGGLDEEIVSDMDKVFGSL